MIIKRDILFEPANKMRTLHIYLPDGYYESDERYPVMYFFDGHNLFYDQDATYGKSWGIKDFLDYWDKKMIIVGIECSHEGNERLTEYCPYNSYGGFLGMIKGTGDQTVHWMVNTLKPLIDQEYRTYSFREATAIGGSSMGGLMSLFAIVKYNKYFSKAACVSSAITFCRNDVMKEIARAKLDPDTRVYLSWGELESGASKNQDPSMDSYVARCNRKAAEELQRRNLITRVYFQPGGGHCEADWEKQVPGFMNFLWNDQ